MSGDERKVATILFADLVGSTALGEQDPERTRAMLDRFYDAMAAEIERAGGTVEKFAGDAVMAAFGAPAALEDHAERALHAALALRRRLAELFDGRLELRIGVNTGEVVVGRPREGSSFVTGDAVNVAARLEQAAAPGEILVGERTAAAVRGAFELGEPEAVEAKGKPAGVPARRLVRPLSLMRPRGVAGLRRAFVGRESELDLLLATYRRAVRDGEPHLVTIMGDAGVGKTRLVRELWERLGAETPQPLRRTGRCLPYGRGITYWPVGEILKEHLGLLESDPPEAARARLGEREILGLALGLDIAGELHPLAAREGLHDAWVDFLEGLLVERPLVVLVEDLHWAEEPLLGLVELTIRAARGPLLLLATARPELLDARPSWGGGRRNATNLALEPLSPEEAGRLLEELLAAELPAALRDALVGQAEGNPFFVEELIGALVDQGVLRREDGGWRAGELPAGYVVPDTVQAVLAARIDLLDDPRKDALQAAAVIGRVFWPGPVQELLGGAEPDLDALEERDFVRRRSGSTLAGEREYAFKHALTREVAYGTLPKARRARLHAAFARWLARVGEGRDEWASLLAHHYAEAVRPEDVDLAWTGAEEELAALRSHALTWLRRAAALAVGRYEIDEALSLLHRAVEYEPNPVRQADVWREIGRANALKYDGEAFWRAMQQALVTCEDRRTCADSYSELAFQTATRAGMWRRRPERELVDGWIEQALELAEPDSSAYAKALVARAWWDRSVSVQSALEGSAIAERLGDIEVLSYGWRALVDSAAIARDYGAAAAWLERRLGLLGRISDPDHLADVHWGAVPVHLARGRFDEARRLAGLHEEVAMKLSPHHRVHGVALLLEVEELAGDWPRIHELRERAERAVAENIATPCVQNQRSLLVCALAEEHLGHPEEARRLESAADSLGMEGYGHVLSAVRARLALVRNDPEAAERLLADPGAAVSGFVRGANLGPLAARMDLLAALGDRERAESEGPPLLQPQTYLEPFALRALGVVRQDEQLLRDAIECFEALGLSWHAAQTRALLF